jgi:hypothetical protein
MIIGINTAFTGSRTQILKYCSLILLLGFSIVPAAQPPKRWYKESENTRLLTLLDSTNNELLKTVNTLTEAQYFFHLDSATWSANDIVEHLGLIDEGYVRECWFTLSQPPYPESYVDSTAGGDEKAVAYASQPEKGKARGTNLPRNRYCNKETGVRIFIETNNMVKEFYTVNAGKDLRRYFIFRTDGKGTRTVRDLHQLGLLLVAHRRRHVDQLRRIIADAGFLK